MSYHSNFTQEQKREFFTNEETWPICQNCGGRINPERYKRAKNNSKGELTEYMHWKDWLNAKCCCRECSYELNGKRMRIASENYAPKKCTTCGKLFYKTADITASRWHTLKGCEKHRKNIKSKVEPKTRQDVIEDTKGKSITRGFYTFRMSPPPEHERRNPKLSCLSYTDNRTRDEKVERICQELKT